MRPWGRYHWGGGTALPAKTSFSGALALRVSMGCKHKNKPMRALRYANGSGRAPPRAAAFLTAVAIAK
jgi:hypothetical protein